MRELDDSPSLPELALPLEELAAEAFAEWKVLERSAEGSLVCIDILKDD